MRISTITLSRNDADLIEAFVRYHARFVDHMLILTHRCQDNTEEILEELVAEGLPVEAVRYEAGDGETKYCRIYESGRTVHRIEALFSRTLADVSKRLQPDWILPIDVDEFVTAGDQTVRDALAAVAPGRVPLVGWRNFIPMPTDDSAEPNALRRIVHRRSAEDPRFNKAFVPRSVALRDRAGLSAGNHRAVDVETGVAFPSSPCESLKLAHFPIRSEEQFRAKILAGYLVVSSNPVMGPQGYHWRDIHPRCKDLTPFTPEELTDIAIRYNWAQEELPLPTPVRDPLRFEPFPLRYKARPVELWDLVNDAAERLAEAVHQLGWDRVKFEEALKKQWTLTGTGPAQPATE